MLALLIFSLQTIHMEIYRYVFLIFLLAFFFHFTYTKETFSFSYGKKFNQFTKLLLPFNQEKAIFCFFFNFLFNSIKTIVIVSSKQRMPDQSTHFDEEKETEKRKTTFR